MCSRRRTLENASAPLLRSHGSSKNLHACFLLHDELTRRGGDPSLLLSNLIIQMYGKCGSLHSARSVFNHMCKRNIFSWNLMIGVYASHGSLRASMDFFQAMCLEFCPDEVTFATAVSACIRHESHLSSVEGMQLHHMVLCYGFESSVVVATALVSMYGKCYTNYNGKFGSCSCKCDGICNVGRNNGDVGKGDTADECDISCKYAGYGGSYDGFDHAQWTFNAMQDRNVFSWNSMLTIYGQHRDLAKEFLQAYHQMLLENVIPDQVSCIAAISTCARLRLLDEGKRVYVSTFGTPFEMDISLQNAAINMYYRCQDLEGAYNIFHNIAEKNLVTWNTMIVACNAHSQGTSLFNQMQLEDILPDAVTFSSSLNTLSGERDYREGQRMHARITRCTCVTDIIVETGIITMYSNCGHIEDARKMFDAINPQHIGIWNAMIAGYAQHGSIKSAFELFNKLHARNIAPNRVTFVTLLSICADEVALNQGMLMHYQIISDEVNGSIEVGNSLIDMYGKCGLLEDALRVFSSMLHHNLVSWSSLITSCIHHDLHREALHLFGRMLVSGVKPDRLIFLHILPSCATETGIVKSQYIHHCIANHDFEMDFGLSIALLNTYSKCGSLKDARTMFDKITCHSLIAWNSMMSAYAHHGQAMNVIELFYKMNLDAIIPDEYTCYSILCAISHTGMVEEGYWCLLYMSSMYNIILSVEHFNRLIDIFGRAGRVDETEYLINNLPFQPSGTSWMTLLSSCQLHLSALDIGNIYSYTEVKE